MGAAQPQLRYSLTEYLTFEESREEKHEFWRGEIYAMAGASPAHNQITFNLTVAVGSGLAGSNCRGFSSDQRLWIESAQLSTYADLTIVYSESQYHEKYRTLLVNPRVIFEVLSPSTAAYDRGEKWECYQQLESLTDYLLVAQDRPQIEHYSLNDGGWRYTREAGLEGIVTIASINTRLLLSEIYSGIQFPPPAPPRPSIQIVIE
jgi:Uma2 family endonuclease